MALTSMDIPEGLLTEAQRLTGQKTKKGAVVQALEEAVARRRQRMAVDSLAGMQFLADIGLPDVRAKARG
jgi:Arc/MetJ family transcription regulator